MIVWRLTNSEGGAKVKRGRLESGSLSWKGEIGGGAKWRVAGHSLGFFVERSGDAYVVHEKGGMKKTCVCLLGGGAES